MGVYKHEYNCFMTSFILLTIVRAFIFSLQRKTCANQWHDTLKERAWKSMGLERFAKWYQ